MQSFPFPLLEFAFETHWQLSWEHLPIFWWPSVCLSTSVRGVTLKIQKGAQMRSSQSDASEFALLFSWYNPFFSKNQVWGIMGSSLQYIFIWYLYLLFTSKSAIDKTCFHMKPTYEKYDWTILGNFFCQIVRLCAL